MIDRHLLLVCCAVSSAGLPACRKEDPPAPSAAAAPASGPPARAQSGPGAPSVPDAGALPKLELVGRSEQPIQLGPVGSQLIAVVSGVLYRIDADGLHQDDALISGLRPLGKWRSFSVHGSFPESSVIIAHPTPDGPEGACRQETIFRWSKERWLPQLELGHCDYTLAVAPWKDGRKLAATRVGVSFNDWKFALAEGKGPIALPAPTPAPPTDAGFEHDRCKTVLIPQSADGTPSGSLFLVGRRCEEARPGAPAVERWAPDSRKASIDALPDAGSTEGSFVVRVRSEKEAYVALLGAKSSYMARFDGAAWKKIAAPAASELADVVLDHAGALWAAQGSRVHRLEPTGAWRGFELPTVDGQPVRAAALSFASDALWVVASRDKTHYLFGPKTPREVTVFPSVKAVHYTEGDHTGPLPASAACANLLVVLRQGAAVGQKFDDVASKLASKAGLEGVQYVIDAGPVGDQLAAVVPSMQVGNRIVELMMEGGKPRPHFVCRKPKVKGDVTLTTEPKP